MTKRTLYAAVGMRAGLPALAALLSMLVAPSPVAARPVIDRGGPTPVANPPCAACVAITITTKQLPALPDRLDGLDVLIRVVAGEERSAAAGLTTIARQGGHAGLMIEGVPLGDLPADLVAQVGRLLIDLGGTPPSQDMAQLAYMIKLRITAARAAAPELAVGIGGSPDLVAALAGGDLDPYVDFVVWSSDPPQSDRHERWRALDDPLTLAGVLRATEATAAQRWLWRLPEAPAAAPIGETLAAQLSGLTRAATLLPPGLVASASVQVVCAGVRADTYLNPQTLETVALAPQCAADAALVVTPVQPGVERIPLSAGDAIIRVPARGGEGAFAEGVDVVGSRSLRVEEIIARHQSAAARQAAAVRQLISRGTLTLTFEAPGFSAPIAISSEAVIYTAAGSTELEQREVRVNGLRFTGRDVPRLPIIEPERVASPPLAITLTGLYRYRLEGRETVGGIGCYVVAFEPLGGGRGASGAASLFRGRAWIAADSFAMIKVAGSQTALRGPIVASEQVDQFADAGSGIWLLARSDVHQMYEGAAHRTPIHRVLVTASHQINPPDFDRRRQSAYASDSVMLRDTAQGYRYLEKGRPDAPGAQPARVIAQRSDRVRALIAGVIVDPNISIPLPFAGLSYVDFNLFGTGTEVNAFFGGTYGQVAFSIPSVRSTRWQLAGRGFGIASSYNDRSFVGGIERYDENVRQRPAQAALWLHRALTPRIAMRIGYDLDYTRFAAGSTTASGFAVPAAQVVHGARFALDAQREGWNASAWWNPARRSGWRPWGREAAGEYHSSQRDFQRYGASLTRSAVVTPRLVVRVEGAWMAGRDLDRFSRYSFGTFDNRLRGYPAALIRYDRGGVLRSAIAWSAGSRLRLDGFLDSAAVHDPGFGPRLRNYTGAGGAVEAPAPFGTLLALEWGYGLRGVNGDGSLGTQVLRVSGYKMF